MALQGVWKVSHVKLGQVITHLKDLCTNTILVITVFNYGHPNVKGTPKQKILKLEVTKLNKVIGTLSTSCYQSYDRSIKYKSVLYLERWVTFLRFQNGRQKLRLKRLFTFAQTIRIRLNIFFQLQLARSHPLRVTNLKDVLGRRGRNSNENICCMIHKCLLQAYF